MASSRSVRSPVEIKVAFAFGLLPQSIYSNLYPIKDIRNRFAHLPDSLTFDSPIIQKEMVKLSIPSPPENITKALKTQTQRENFLLITFWCVVQLQGLSNQNRKTSLEIPPLAYAKLFHSTKKSAKILDE